MRERDGYRKGGQSKTVRRKGKLYELRKNNLQWRKRERMREQDKKRKIDTACVEEKDRDRQKEGAATRVREG